MKRVIAVVLVTALMGSLGGCQKKGSSVKNADATPTVVSENKKENKVNTSGMHPVEKLMAEAQNRRDVSSILNECADLYVYASNMEKALKGNTIKAEFDPTDEEKIPQNIKEICNPISIKECLEYDADKKYNLLIDGENVSLEVNGNKYYPIEGGMEPVVEWAEKYKAKFEN